MRTMLERHSSHLRRSTFLAPAFLWAVVLLLAACHGDVTTGVGTNDAADIPNVRFTLPAGYSDAAAGAAHLVVRTFPTIPLRPSVHANLVEAAGSINSPLDLTYYGGPLVTHAMSTNVYINCPSNPASCWGTNLLSPATFLADLNQTNFIGVADQYLGGAAAGKFFVTQLNAPATFTNNTATMNDVIGIVIAASTFTEASGYTNIFHVFLPQGTDMCITPIDCYSPNIDSTFTFCAFHSSFDYNGEHLLFSVEPYQAVRGCAGPAPRVIDATASALSHEFFETITDPDGSAWFNGLVGYEMADVCVAFHDNVFMRSHNYVIQEEYSNAVHACTDGA